MAYLFPTPDGPASAFWTSFNETFLPMRMPLFFVAAGLLAHDAMSRPWRAVLHPRIVTLIWPYLLWSLAFAAVAGFAYRPDSPADFALQRLVSTPLAASPYWFLAILVLFFVAARTLRPWAPVVLAGSLALAVAAPFLEPLILETVPGALAHTAVRVSRYAFWYLLGCYATERVHRLARIDPVSLFLGGSAAFAGLTWVASRADVGAELRFVLSGAGLAGAVGFSVLVARSERVRSISRYVAARTLAIYLIHPMIICLILLTAVLAGGPSQPNGPWATALTPLLSVFCIVVSVAVYDRVSATSASWLFTAPRRVVNSRSGY